MKISAIVTCYNVEEYVAITLQSVLDCGFDDLELIVVDDCSNDGTQAIIKAIADDRHDVSIQPVFFSKNTIGGVATAANAGLDLATGDIVLFVDGDDWVIPKYTKQAVEMLWKSKADFIVCNCSEYWNHDGKYSQYPEHHLWGQVAAEWRTDRLRNTLLEMAPFPWRKIYRRSFLEEKAIRFPVGDFFFEDNPFHWETTTKAEKFLFLNEITHVHRMNRTGQTIGANGARFIKIFDHAQIMLDKLKKDDLFESYKKDYAKWLYKHILWCSRYVPPGFLNEVFERANPLLKELPAHTFWEVVSTSGYNAKDVRKIAAIFLNKRFEFLQEF